jgi:protein-disulfide isomerase
MMKRAKTILPVMTAAIALCFIAALPAAGQSSRADIEAVIQNYLAEHPEAVQQIVKDYLVKNPDVMREVLAELVKSRRGAVAPAADASKVAAIQSNAKLLLSSPHQVTLGNPQGDVTLVEFFDYNCGYCKRALSDMTALMNADPKLRIVLKEFPILGPGSTEAARVAVAARIQDVDGRKYLAFHQTLLNARGPANKDAALAAAKAAGFDMARLQIDMESDEVNATLTESGKLARAVGINGTPGYVVGDAVVAGAVGVAALKERIETARRRTN